MLAQHRRSGRHLARIRHRRGIRLDPHDHIAVCAPHGLDDLLEGVWRFNPTRVSPETSRQRLARHRPTERWPGIRIIT
ncbi:nucleotidyltransferase family protein [Micromonospora sp. NPDC048999]|uniref:nucleotidyltransferase family protein n=1 Tax=Micromonospora sp. NPDC048999 TaxID=3155391 RepID=UPI0033E9E6E9